MEAIFKYDHLAGRHFIFITEHQLTLGWIILSILKVKEEETIRNSTSCLSIFTR